MSYAHDLLVRERLKRRLLATPSLARDDVSSLLIEVVTGETKLSSSGYPYISDHSFELFRDRVPHLFRDGFRVLDWCRRLESELESFDGVAPEALESARRALKVLRTVVFTAAVTAPPDLYLIRHVLSAHRELGTIDHLRSGRELVVSTYAAETGLSQPHLESDLRFLCSRGLLERAGEGYIAGTDAGALDALEHVGVIDPAYRTDMVLPIARWMAGNRSDDDPDIPAWLRIAVQSGERASWIPTAFDTELGYRLLSVALGLRAAGFAGDFREGNALGERLAALSDNLVALLTQAGLLHGGVVTELGERVFERGLGPYAIIATYHPYMLNLTTLLRAGQGGAWVQRGDNVAASQDANRKTFEAANRSLDRFRAKYHFQFEVFIEHAVGQGEATRQRYARDGEEQITYVGADLEDAAIDRAVAEQERGALPRNMLFVRHADIGDAARVVDFLGEKGLAEKPTVMVVGNGFHEIRNQTNERMVEVFRAYAEAGYILIFTEESGLEDDDLLRTAWNTYHAGFRYVHELSGQGLRPARERAHGSKRWNWRTCATLGGYLVLNDFSYRTRTIYPYTPPDQDNPSISETYFCVPYRIASVLGVIA